MMPTGKLRSLLILGAVGWASIVRAQTAASAFPPSLNTEQNPLRHVSAGALGGRSPGNMVSAGVARTLAAADFGRSIIEITEPPPGPDPQATFLIDAIEEVFTQLNQALLLLENALRLRAGLPPRVPIDLSAAAPDTAQPDTTTERTLGDLAGRIGGQ